MTDDPLGPELEECAACGAIGIPGRIEAHDCDSFIGWKIVDPMTDTRTNFENPVAAIVVAREIIENIDTDELPDNADSRILTAGEQLDNILMGIDARTVLEYLDCE